MSKTTGPAAGDAGANRALERVVKGFANHRRIQILKLLENQDNLSLLDICQRLRISAKTGSEHLRRIHLAGLIEKQNDGRWVRHRLTPTGRDVLTFLRMLQG